MSLPLSYSKQLLAIHPVSTKHSISGLFLILCRSRTEFAYFPLFPLSSRETTPKNFSLICFYHLNHRLNGTTKRRLPKICGKEICVAGRTAGKGNWMVYTRHNIDADLRFQIPFRWLYIYLE